jgi:predicted RNA-binding Zn-ribbon protein involved in translation (DUF1610 family)
MVDIKMVSWGRAFKAALVLLAFSILWGIIGGIIIFGTTTMLLTALSDPTNIGAYLGSMAVTIIICIIGGLISFLGTWASAFRIATNLAIEEMKKTMPVATTPPVATQAAGTSPTCPTCGTQLTYVQQYQRWYCPTCREYR